MQNFPPHRPAIRLTGGLVAIAMLAAAWPSLPADAQAPLNGQAAADVRARLGEPDLTHIEGSGALWTYRFDDCALMVAFRDGPEGLRVTQTISGPRRRGETPPSAAECVASGEAAFQARTPHAPAGA